MSEFSNNTKQWLRIMIRQRKLLIRLNKSHKDRVKEQLAIDRLETQLNAYPYDNDLYLARFIRKFQDDINTILPGKGSTNFEKAQLSFKDINTRAILIISANIKFRQLEIKTS